MDGHNSLRAVAKKIEIAFISFKADMFDSLESVVVAAMNDPDCEAYIVPVPYYDRKPGGEFGKIHYETDFYPDSINITDWRLYNIEQRKPDIIFTNNLYDDANRVTSIHPDFYNKRLKGFTGLLVYVPYYICLDDVRKHLCVSKGTMYADKVILQSERVRHNYISAFREFEIENNCAGYFGDPQTKFVALGSPKYDKTINAKNEKHSVPEEWIRLINKSDSSHKSIVFYNTTINAALEGNAAYLRKIQLVFETFRKWDDVVLLWRPHPLSEVTFKAMRPRFFGEYMCIVDEYKKEGFGIFDDTHDLHRAIALSDCYYGDMSSIVPLFGYTGKPAMIQNISVISANDSIPKRLGEVDSLPRAVMVEYTDNSKNMLYFEEEVSHIGTYIDAVISSNMLLYDSVKNEYASSNAGEAILNFCKQTYKRRE